MLEVVGIKFNNNGKVYLFEPIAGLEIGDDVVVDTANGHELAKVVEGLHQVEDDKVVQPLKKVVRKASEKDLRKMQELVAKKSEIIEKATDLVKKYNLDMKIVDVDWTLDNPKTTIYFVCEDRVDFRDLVKDLAGLLKQRIELRQIGIRDHAKRIGGLGACGKECCCKQFLNDFDKVSVKMAKTQGLSLNPTKISGVCGRLMCCLSYENEYYSEVNAKMPKLNALVKTPNGKGIVVYNNLLKQVVSVRHETDGDVKVEEYPLDKIEIIAKENNGKK